MVLVDTVVWLTVFRRNPKDISPEQSRVKDALVELVESDQAKLLGVVRQELLSGLRDHSRFLRLRKLLRAFPDVPLERDDYEEAAAVNNTCRSRGVAGNSVDFLICAVALRRRWAILTLDQDFAGYASCVPVEIHRG